MDGAEGRLALQHVCECVTVQDAPVGAMSHLCHCSLSCGPGRCSRARHIRTGLNGRARGEEVGARVLDVADAAQSELRHLLNAQHAAIRAHQLGHAGCQVAAATAHVQRPGPGHQVLLQQLQSAGVHVGGGDGLTLAYGEWMVLVCSIHRAEGLVDEPAPVHLLHHLLHTGAAQYTAVHQEVNQLGLRGPAYAFDTKHPF
mmetsp:Transcript_10711/g.23027  ORF Transcript_10711/g.23027 Transcript_10711/m.23027 type:complete len:200 (-) Transcript_10711:107-706(-)